MIYFLATDYILCTFIRALILWHKDPTFLKIFHTEAKILFEYNSSLMLNIKQF